MIFINGVLHGPKVQKGRLHGESSSKHVDAPENP